MIVPQLRNVKHRTFLLVGAAILAAHGLAAAIALVVGYVGREPDVDLLQLRLTECGRAPSDPSQEAANLRVLQGNWSVDEGAMIDRVRRGAFRKGDKLIDASDRYEWEKDYAKRYLRADEERTRPQWLTEAYREMRAHQIELSVRPDGTWSLSVDGKHLVGDWVHCGRGILCATRTVGGDAVHGRDQITFRVFILEADERPRHGTVSLDLPTTYVQLRKRE